MKTYFMSQGLWEIVDKGYTVPADASSLSSTDKENLEKSMEKDNLALYILQMAVVESLFPRISGAKTSKEAWDILKKEYQGSDKVSAMAENFALEKIVTEVVDKFIVQPIKHQCDYLRYFTRNVNHLNEEHQNLRNAIDGMKARITAAENNAEEILPEVSTWLERANERLTFKEEIMSQVNTNSCCLCVKSRYSLSRRAVKATEAIKKLREESPKPDQPITVPPRALAAAPDRLARSIVEFDSRKRIEKDVMDHLRDENVKVIGIHGMGGVGKTTLAKKIRNRVLSDGEFRFDESPMVVISQDPDMMRIQGEIAEKLGLKFEETSLSSRAERLCGRLMGGKRILVILDDVWKSLDLDELGIPCVSGSGRCTVLLTSRDRDVLHRMGARKSILEMEILEDEEAWSFFKEKLGGISADDPTWLSSKAQEMGLGLWSGDFEGTEDHLGQVRNRTYSLIETIKSRSLLLESRKHEHVRMHDVVRDIAIYIASSMEKRLIKCGQDCEWLSPFRGERNIDLSGGSTLSKLRLLMIERSEKGLQINDDSFEGMIKLNVLYINLGWKTKLLPRSTGSLKDLRTLIIESCGELRNIGIVGELIKLEILICRNCYGIEELCWDTNNGPKCLRLLEISGCGGLRKIGRGVIASVSKLEEMMIVSSFTEWEEEGLREVERLQNLRRLEIQVKNYELAALQITLPNMHKFRVVFGDPKVEWVNSHPFMLIDDDNRDVVKLISLNFPKEISLGTWIQGTLINNVEYLCIKKHVPNDLDLSRAINVKLLEMDYCSMERDHLWSSNMVSHYILLSTIKVDKCCSLHSLLPISRGSDCFPQLKVLHISDCEMLQYVFSWIEQENENNITEQEIREGIHQFPLLTKVNIRWCPQLKGLISSFQGREDDHHSSHFFSKIRMESFCKLEVLEIDYLKKVKSLFSIDQAQNLVNLEKLVIERCHEMVLVIGGDGDENIIEQVSITFPNLKQLKLNYLPRLTSFYEETKSIEFPVLQYIRIWGCPELKRTVPVYEGIILGGGESDHQYSSHLFCHHQVLFTNNCRRLNVEGSESINNLLCSQIDLHLFTKLEEISISCFHKMKSLFSVSIARDLVNLHTMNIRWCKEMIQVIGGDEDKKDNNIGQDAVNYNITVFPKLKEFELYNLPKLTSVYKGNGNIKFPMLQDLFVLRCQQFNKAVSCIKDTKMDHHLSSHLFTQYPQVSLSNLKNLRLWSVESREIPIDLITGLEKLDIRKCNGMSSLFSCSMAAKLINLRKLRIEDCVKMVQVIEEEKECSSHDSQTTLLHHLFPRLVELRLENLPELKIFSGCSRCGLTMALLKDANIESCPKMEGFSLGSLTPSNLERVWAAYKLKKPDEIVEELWVFI